MKLDSKTISEIKWLDGDISWRWLNTKYFEVVPSGVRIYTSAIR